ncbi:MAG: hypothetical protein ACKOWG_15190 [Planctomycetia bacterium]
MYPKAAAQAAAGLRDRMHALGSRRVPYKGGVFWDYKPDFKPGDVVEL